MGIDIGSSTSHVMLARLRLQRLADALSSRYVIAERKVIGRSPIIDTPLRDGLIDVAALDRLVDETYSAAGLERADVDTGAVILTGVALERANARAIDEHFAAKGGAFVCATAGHRLEAILSAHGSGGVAISRAIAGAVLVIDVGGGTTKLALCDRGEITSVSAIRVGARHVPLPIDRMADAVVDAASGRTTGLELLPPLASNPRPDQIIVVGGVSEHFYRRDRTDHGDRGIALADALRARVGAFPGRVVESTVGIQATVIGASQFTVQLSGSTIFLSDERALPLRNVPVVRAPIAGLGAAVAALDDKSGPLALAVDFREAPRHAALLSLGRAVQSAAGEHRPLVVALDADVAHTLGRVLVDELGMTGTLVIVDGLELRELDYVDVGEVVRPAGVVPVVIKSLVF
ncbi:MAG TPA: ethanolamine ammonia-lyase reactivating factor EutA [Methylomirabilota bacterium]|nr:ethanolamine ammonia-lyase reactivating factor EutA [Methylomirabilota bacterium]